MSPSKREEPQTGHQHAGDRVTPSTPTPCTEFGGDMIRPLASRWRTPSSTGCGSPRHSVGGTRRLMTVASAS
eukprot:1189323-Prorocentrum_minimum.AAC.2